jgi:hypothetical protein
MFTKRFRRFIVTILVLVGVAGTALLPNIVQNQSQPTNTAQPSGQAAETLQHLPIKGRAPKTGYSRQQFGDGWEQRGACDVRNLILGRDLSEVRTVSDEDCTVVKGKLVDPYTGKTILFQRGPQTSGAVQIDHVVALSDAWQKGAQQLSAEERQTLANDPLNLLAVDGPTNMAKGDGDAATWLPPNKEFRCRYVARQIAVKTGYRLWVTQAEYDAMARILQNCPGQQLPIQN